MSVGVFRSLGLKAAVAGMFAALLALGVPVAAQMYSKGYTFLEAVDKREGDKVTEMLNDPAAGKSLINTRDITTGDTGLHIATERRDALWVRFLLQRGADANIRNKTGVTPLQLAVRLGFVEGAEELLKSGAQVDVSDSQGETPLIAAVHQRNVALVKRLLAVGANPDRNDNSGRSARDYAKLMGQNTLLLLEFEKADQEREGKEPNKNYGPSF